MTQPRGAQAVPFDSPNTASGDAALRRSLPCAWHAFFARFAHLRPIQAQAIPVILRGASAIVNAPTASGKTEAIMAPIVERVIRRRQKAGAAAAAPQASFAPPRNIRLDDAKNEENAKPWFEAISDSKSADFYSGSRRSKDMLNRLPQPEIGNDEAPVCLEVLVVAPTKALCNDLLRRLDRPVRDTGLSAGIRTGDNPNLQAANLPDILITTPESFDSILARKPAILRSVAAVVIDEIHLLAGSGRGDQLQCLLERLKLLTRHPLQICASSATVPEIERIAADFLGSGAEIVSTSSSRRAIESTIEMISDVPGTAIEETARYIEKIVGQSPTCKVLAFCNARRNVENITFALRSNARMAAKVFAHHGSLSREERLRTEQQFLRARNAACIATSTLELGIDIGDVDRIVLLGPPPDVSSLIQRIGRGCRHQSTVYATCLADCPFNAHRFMHLAKCAQEGLLFPDPVAVRPTAIVQQALSICLQNPKKWVGKQALYDRLSPAARALYELRECEEILDNMVSGGLFRKVGKGRYVPEAKAQFLFDRGYMHSLIADRGETDVVDTATGRTLGSVFLKKSNKEALALGGGVTLTLGGSAHAVSHIRDKKIFVTRSDDAASATFMALEPPRYSLGLARHFAQYMHIPDDALYVRCVLQGEDSYRNFTPQSGDNLRYDVPKPASSTLAEYHVNHFLGTVGSFLLQSFFEHHGTAMRSGTRSPFFMRLTKRPPMPSFPDAGQLAALFEMYIRSDPKKFAKVLQPGPQMQLIPEETLVKWILKSIDIGAYAQILALKRIVVL